MRLKRPLPCVLLLLLCCASAQAAPERSLARWHTDLETARAESKRLNRPLLMHFFADWCGPCHRMDREVLNSSGLLSQLGRGFVAVKINSDQHPELIDQYDIRALPSDVFVDPSGRVIAQTDGFQDLRTYQTRLASVERAFLDAERVHIAGGGSGETPIPSPQGPAILQPSITPVDSPEGPRDGIDRSAVDVGLGGYSPISLWNERGWRKGSPEFASSHKGVVYFMASARELQQFQAAPERYAPQFLGCDPVILSESKRAVKGSPEYGAYFGGMLYLFVSMETRARFSDSPQRYSGSQHTLRINQIERRLVRVSERQSGRKKVSGTNGT